MACSRAIPKQGIIVMLIGLFVVAMTMSVPYHGGDTAGKGIKPRLHGADPHSHFSP